MVEPEIRQKFLEAMSRGSTFVSVLTTDGDSGRFGVTVSSMTSVSVDGEAPTILACVHQKSPVAQAILSNRLFCANILHEGQQVVSDLFSGRDRTSHQQRFDSVEWTRTLGGQPLLTGATANFDCVLRTSVLWESHYILIAHVSEIVLNDNPNALLYGQRTYRRSVGFD